MDMPKIGRFLAALRHEQGLTQEQLGEKLGVAGKTISRWETARYLPPVEMLQLLSKQFGVSINELLAGQRLTETDFRAKAEENLCAALKDSVFSRKEKIAYYRRKWRRDHRFERIFAIIALALAVLVGVLCHRRDVPVLAALAAVIWSAILNNRMMGYVEERVYGDGSGE